MTSLVDNRPSDDESEGDQPLDAQEQVYLAYVKRWAEHGRRTSCLTKDQVIQCFADYPFQDAAGKDAINQLLEVVE